MAPGINASGLMGIAHETTPGTYVAPAKYVPFLSEQIKFQQDTQWRRPIRQSPDVIGAVAGDSFIGGALKMEALHDCVPYFLYCSRVTVVKSGVGPYVYTCTPSAVAIPARTMSITIVRNGIVFGYTGCVVASFKFSIDNGQLMYEPEIVGRDEAVQSTPTAAWPTSVPFGAGSYNLQIPTATQVFDTDKFEFNVDDKGTPNFRLKNTGTGAQFIAYGERDVKISVERDFDTRTEYDIFKSETAQSLSLIVGSAPGFTLTAPTTIVDTYEVDLNNQGDLVRAKVDYVGTLGASSAYTLIASTPESIT